MLGFSASRKGPERHRAGPWYKTVRIGPYVRVFFCWEGLRNKISRYNKTVWVNYTTSKYDDWACFVFRGANDHRKKAYSFGWNPEREPLWNDIKSNETCVAAGGPRRYNPKNRLLWTGARLRGPYPTGVCHQPPTVFSTEKQQKYLVPNKWSNFFT